MHDVEVDSSQNCASLQMFQFVAVGVLKKCDLRSGQKVLAGGGVCVCVCDCGRDHL